MVGIGDGETPDLPLGECSLQSFQRSIDFQGRGMEGEKHYPADGIEGSCVAHEVLVGKLQHVVLISGEKYLEGRAILDLGLESAGGVEGELHLAACVAPKVLGHLGQRELQVSDGCDNGHSLGSASPLGGTDARTVLTLRCASRGPARGGQSYAPGLCHQGDTALS
jgi:hypothetical protein